MSRLQTYLDEKNVILPVDHVNDIKGLIQKNCKPFLSATNNGRMKFYRGMSVLYYDHRKYAGEKSTRQDREPRGMNIEFASELNKWLEKHGHIRRDKSVFATSDRQHADIFGNIYQIFPIGKFDYTFVKMKDIKSHTSKYIGLIEKWAAWTGIKDFNEVFTPKEIKTIESIFVTNTDIKLAKRYKYEMWFGCKSYYYLREDTIMRLSNYLNETIDPGIVKDIWAKLTKDCMPFLKELKKSNSPRDKFFYRGFHGGMYSEIQRKKVRADRKPTDTPENVSKYVDKEFKKKFGWNVRSEGAFATSSRDRSSEYGTPFLFFPIGKYKYAWSEDVTDMYSHLGGRFLSYTEDILSGKADENDPEIDLVINDFKDTVNKAINTFQTNNMRDAMISQSEIIFKCKEYLAVKTAYALPLYELMEKEI